MPLQWPANTPRTPADERHPGRFQVGYGTAKNETLEELRQLKGEQVVITTDRERSGHKPQDPGVAVWFKLAGREYAFPCDKYQLPEHNLRAIGVTVGAMRLIARHGVTMRHAAMVGFEVKPALAETAQVIYLQDASR